MRLSPSWLVPSFALSSPRALSVVPLACPGEKIFLNRAQRTKLLMGGTRRD
jgi:hypothetical protein